MKVKKHYPIHVYDKTFMVNFYISYGVCEHIYQKAVKGILQCEPQVDLKDGNMSIYDNKKNGSQIYWIWTKYKDVSCLVHECFHAIHFLLKDKGIKLSHDSDEIYAYMLQMLVKEVLK
jgi:hypothetical protein